MRGKKRPATERVTAVALAEVNGVEAASVQTGIPSRTIRVWMDRPEFADLRSKTRDELADGFRAYAHLALTRLMEAAQRGDIEPRDLATSLGIAVDKMLVMRGEATSRTETRTWTDDLNDDEKQRLRDWIDSLDDPATADGQGAPAGATADAGAEVR